MLGLVDGANGGETRLGPVPISWALGIGLLGAGMTGLAGKHSDKLSALASGCLAVGAYNTARPAGAAAKKQTREMFARGQSFFGPRPASQQFRTMPQRSFRPRVAGADTGFVREADLLSV